MIRALQAYGSIRLTGRLLSWGIVAVLPLFVTPARFGVLVVFFAVESIVGSILICGQDRATLRLTSTGQFPAEPLAVTCVSTALCALGLHVTGSFRPIAALLHLDDYRVVIWAFWAGAASALIALCDAAVRRDDARTLYFITEVGRQLGRSSGLAAGLIVSGTVLTVAVSYSAGLGLVALGCVAILLRRMDWAMNVKRIGRSLRFGAPFILHVTGGALLIYVDRILLQRLAGPAVVGVYSVAYVVGSTVGFVYGLLGTAFEPFVYRRARRGRSIERYLADYRRAALALASILALLFSIAATVLIVPIYGTTYHAAISIVPVVAVSYVIMGLSKEATYALTVLQRPSVVAVGSALGAALNVGLNLLWIPRWGAYGAASATYVSFACQAGLLVASSTLWGAQRRARNVVKTYIGIVAVGTVTIVAGYMSTALAIGMLAIEAAIASFALWVRRCRVRRLLTIGT